MKKRFFIALVLLLLLSTYNIQNNFKLNSILTIEKIIIKNNQIISEQEVKKKLSFLYDTNLFFLKTKKIKSKLNEIEFIKSFKINKIYPNKIKIQIFEKKTKAKIQKKKEKKY